MHRIRLAHALGLALAAGLATPAGLTAQAGTSAPLSADQAERGRRIYGAFCATCHGVDLEGAVGPALAGAGFSGKWSQPGRSVADLFHLISTTMPRPAAGSLAEAS
jgi:mono/diheme cytochrome c family protein